MRAVVEIWLKSLIDDFTLEGLHSALNVHKIDHHRTQGSANPKVVAEGDGGRWSDGRLLHGPSNLLIH